MPYFRIFNPVTQSERFDPEGEFIKRYCPELKDLDKKSIHSPHERAPLLAQAIGYPKPIVDLKTTRQAAINKLVPLRQIRTNLSGVNARKPFPKFCGVLLEVFVVIKPKEVGFGPFFY